MIEAIEPLAAVPGVRIAVLVSPDGVPVVVRGKAGLRSKAGNGHPTLLEESPDSLAGLAVGWLQGLTAAVAPLGWHAPVRVVLRAARGTLVMLQAPGSVLAAVLDPGADAEELRLPMEATVARMHRILRTRAASPPAPPLPGDSAWSPEEGKGPRLVRVDRDRKPRPFPG